ncbi:MAG: NADH-quinone oxidoreductase subunit J [Bernardetiaceae bacterium]|nr:NADH-quinone oxidoreductase subunit J [Bernardetiaceae bacterium]
MDIALVVVLLCMIGSAVAMLFTKNIIYAALFLLLSLLSIAALYVLAGAEFLALAQIALYVGGVLVLIIFALMFTQPIQGVMPQTETKRSFLGIWIGLMLFGFLAYFIVTSVPIEEQRLPTQTFNFRFFSAKLFSEYIIAVELAGMLLTVVLVGVAFLAARARR